MNIRYVIRHPHVLSTPRLLSQALNVRHRIWPNPSPRMRPSFNRDFLFIYPETERLLEQDPETRSTVTAIREFFQANKAFQRTILRNWNLPIPWTTTDRTVAAREAPGGKYVIRRNRHWKGQHFRVTDDPTDFIEGQEYVSQLFEKQREYRIVYVYGEPLVVLRKKVPEGTSSHLPWNHEQGASFQTINDVAGSRLSQAGAFQVLATCPLIQKAHIVGVDIMYRKGEWKVLEFNAAPALTIENNVAKVADFIRNRN